MPTIAEIAGNNFSSGLRSLVIITAKLDSILDKNDKLQDQIKYISGEVNSSSVSPNSKGNLLEHGIYKKQLVGLIKQKTTTSNGFL